MGDLIALGSPATFPTGYSSVDGSVSLTGDVALRPIGLGSRTGLTSKLPSVTRIVEGPFGFLENVHGP